MKKNIILVLAALPLLFSSCLKEDKDLFDESASARVERVQTETERILNAAPNGWQMKYYPHSTQIYGGITLFMKFDAGEVTVASEHGKAGQTARSLYSYDADEGATLNFDTYNPLFHCYSEPNSGVGEVNSGMDGDAEFIIVSYSADEVVLKGKRTGNIIRMTPLPEGRSWTELMKEYADAVAGMERVLSYSLWINGTTYEMYRDEASDYPSRHFCIVAGDEVIEAPYIYTLTGIEFYRPVSFEGMTFEGFDFRDGKFFCDAYNARIEPIVSDMKLTVRIESFDDCSVKYSVQSSTRKEYFYTTYFPAAEAEELGSDEAVIRALMGNIGSMNDLSQGSATVDADCELDPETEYYAVAFGVGVSSGGTVYATTGLASKKFTTEAMPAFTDDYAAWLGTWTVTSTGSINMQTSAESRTPISFDVVIEPKAANRKYKITGWGVSSYRNEFAITADYDAESGAFGILNNQTLYTDPDGASVVVLGVSRVVMGGQTQYTIFGDLDYLLLAQRSSATAAQAVGASGDLQGGGTFEALFADCFVDEDGDIYFLMPADGYTSYVYPTGPYTMTKTAGPAAAKRSPAARPSAGTAHTLGAHVAGASELKANK